MRPIPIGDPKEITGGPGDGGATANLEWYRQLLGFWLWLFLLVAVVVGAITYVYASRFVRPTYQAEATLVVHVAQVGDSVAGSDVLMSQEYAPTAARLLDSYPVATIAYRRLHLHPPLTPGYLLDKTDTSAIPNSQLITVSFQSTDPAFATQAANMMAQVGAEQEATRQAARYKQALRGIDQQLKTDQANLADLRRRSRSGDAAATAQLPASQSSVASLLQRRLDLATAAAEATTTLAITVPADQPLHPISPQPVRSGALAAVLTLITALGLFAARDRLRLTLRNPGDVAYALGNPPVVGIIPKHPAIAARASLVSETEKQAPLVEAFRMLRTNVLYLKDRALPHVILITSARQSEGKTTIAANLAASLASLGQCTLVIDADLRRPAISDALGLPADEMVSWPTLLASGRTVDLAICPTKVENLFVLPTRYLPSDPAALLGSTQMEQMISHLRSTFDIIIIDSPPVLAVTDAAILSRLSDALLLVTDTTNTTYEQMIHTREALERVGTRIAGLILNRAASGRRDSYYYRYRAGA